MWLGIIKFRMWVEVDLFLKVILKFDDDGWIDFIFNLNENLVLVSVV